MTAETHTSTEASDTQPILHLSDVDLHQDFPHYYRDTLVNPDHPDRYGNAVILLDHLLQYALSLDLQDPYILASYTSPQHLAGDIDRPRLYREQLATTLVDLGDIVGYQIEVTTGFQLERQAGRLSWRSRGEHPRQSEVRGIIDQLDLPISIDSRITPAPNQDSTEKHHFHLPRRHKELKLDGEIFSTQPDLRVAIMGMSSAEEPTMLNRVYLLPGDYQFKKDPAPLYPATA